MAKILWAMGAMLFVPVGAALWLTQPIGHSSAKRLAFQYAPEALEKDVRQIVTGFGPRDVAHPENLDRLADWLAEEFKKAGGRVSRQPVEGGAIPSVNVIAEFGPDTPERLIVGAHYDARGPLPGADDNASGVAGLLMLSRAMQATPPSMRVELVAYALEEYGLWGSRAHAQKLMADGKKVRAMFSLEMIGSFSDAPQSQNMPWAPLKWLYPSTGHFIAVVGPWNEPMLVRNIKSAMQAYGDGLHVRSINAPSSIRGVDFSDHASFWANGIPAVMVTDTAFFRNPRYHTAQDTPDTLDYQRMSQVVRGVHGALIELARSE